MTELYHEQVGPFDGFEIHPCRIFSSGDHELVEQCDTEEAEFWSVYIHLKEGGLSCIADCNSREEAEKFVGLLEKIIENKCR